MEIKLKSITPIHIGNGDELYELDYLVRDNTYYRITQRKFLSFLSSHKNTFSLYAQWIEDNSTGMEDLSSSIKYAKNNNRDFRDFNGKLSAMRSSFNLYAFCEKYQIQGALLDFLKFDNDVLKISGVKNFNRGQVRGNIKDGSNNFYLPGSSLKGSIRTSILFDLITQDDSGYMESALNSAVRNAKSNEKREKLKKQFSDSIEHHYLYCGFETDKGNVKWSDEKFDIMKLLKISDAYAIENKLGVNKINLYVVEKERNRNTTTLVAKEQNQGPYVENFVADNEFTCNLEFDIDFVLALKNKILEDENKISYILQNGTKVWIDIKSKLQKVFGLDIAKLDYNNKDSIKGQVLENILLKVRNFSQKQKITDSLWFENFKRYDSRDGISAKILSNYNSVQKTENLIHLGYATGFNGVTEVLAIKSNDKLQPLVKEYLELFGIGDKPGANKQRRNGEVYTVNTNSFPKSRRLITLNDNQISPMGWLQILNLRTETVPEKVILKEREMQFFSGKLKVGSQMMATILKSGNPNKVKVHFAGGNEPELDLLVYRSPFSAEQIGKLILVEVLQISRDNIIQVKFSKFL